jgi:hypothetical protein
LIAQRSETADENTILTTKHAKITKKDILKFRNLNFEFFFVSVVRFAVKVHQ